MELKQGRFYNIVLTCQGFGSTSRAKDVRILNLEKDEAEKFAFDNVVPTHRLIFYDCTCGGMKELVGVVEKDEEEIVFAISPEKKFIIKELSR
jgi:hypothetical protein